MPIVIGERLKSKIVDTQERAQIEVLLIGKAANSCFLCKQLLNIEVEKISADHNIPEADGGPTDANNLNLVHEECNLFKNKYATLRIQKYLPLRRFLIDNPGSNFEQVSKRLFKINASEVFFKVQDGLMFIEDVNKSVPFGPHKIFAEEIGELISPVKYIFARLPIKYLFNDDVQPRSIKTEQAFKIFQDLHLNPLHEPVGARLEFPINTFIDGERIRNKIMMFDGQHKTIARALFQINGDFSAVELDVKIYIDFSRDQAVQLVNSIQSIVPKLSLTRSEFARKMAEEFGPQFEEYERACASASVIATEKGFVSSAPAQDRSRRRKALEQARLKQLMTYAEGNEIELMNLVHSKNRNWQIKENTLFSKVFQKFLIVKPLDFKLDSDDTDRTIERHNIQIVLRLMYEELYTVTPDNPAEHVKMFLTQSCLSFVGDLTKSYVKYCLRSTVPDRDFFAAQFEQRVMDPLRSFYINFRKHPIWKYNGNAQGHIKIERFYTRIQKNESLLEYSDSVGLNISYCSELSPLIPNWYLAPNS